MEKVFTSKSVRTGPSSYEKGIYRAAVSQRLRNTGLGNEGWKNEREKEEQDRQCTNSVTLRRVCATIVAAEMQKALHILSV